jgi:hypothetical protein
VVFTNNHKGDKVEAVLINSHTLPEPISSLIGAPWAKASPRDGGVFLTAAADSETPRKPTIDEIFDAYLFPMKDFKFDRDEANNYD